MGQRATGNRGLRGGGRLGGRGGDTSGWGRARGWGGMELGDGGRRGAAELGFDMRPATIKLSPPWPSIYSRDSFVVVGHMSDPLIIGPPEFSSKPDLLIFLH